MPTLIVNCVFMIVFSVFFSYYLIKKSNKKLPKAPSPFKLPIIGHVHLMAKYPGESWRAFNEIQDKYGKIVELKLGIQKFLLVADVNAVKEIILTNGKIFANRPFLVSVDKFVSGIENVIHFSSWSESHKQLRQIIAFHTLTSSTSKEIHDQYNQIAINEFKNLMQSLSWKNSGNDGKICLSQLRLLVGSVFFEHFWNGSVNTNTKDFQQFLVSLQDCHETMINGSIVDIFPFLDKLGFFPSSIVATADGMMKYLENDAGLVKWKESMHHHISSPLEGNREPNNCLIESLIKHHLMNSSNLSWTKCVSTVVGLLLNIPNVTNMVMACLGYLSLDLEAQKRIRAEIREKFSQNDDIISTDQSTKLVQIKAAIMETLRLISSPYLPHCTTEDTSVNGYRVDKGTSVLVNAQYINHSPDLWESPLEFKPSRFLIPSEDGSGVQIKKPPFFLPYSLGRRSCPGFGIFESLAPFVVANLLKKFQVSTSYNRHEMEKRGLCNFSSMKHGNFFALSLKAWESPRH
ncbi:cytochrome P450 307a1-like [Brevipalpus obovatus]|uniref:cytochrome P450 307a1-like n=1 Tax=Brevipalpus obovatus TaxID=246614 RepID=UPI003D9EF9AF